MLAPRTKNTLFFLLAILIFLASNLAIATASDDEATYEFRIQHVGGGSGFSGFGPRVDEGQEPWGRRVLRHRNGQPGQKSELATNDTNNIQKSKDASSLSQQETLKEEDQGFWYRILQGETSMPPEIAMDEVPADMEPVTTLPPEPVGPVSTCPTRVEVSCIEATSGERTPCQDLEPPPGNAGEGCLVNVVFGYKITNTGDETEQIYSLVVQRGDRTTIVTDVPDAVPTQVLEPGDSVTATTGQVLEMDICGPEGLGVFDTKADVITGPPSSVSVQIACESEEGMECREISPTFNQDPDEDDCAVDVIYTYTVFNIGESDFNIIVFERTRNDEYLDLLPLLYTAVFVPVGGSAAVQESEQIDRCIDQTFSTSTLVTKLPPADTVCQDRAYYPPTR